MQRLIYAFLAAVLLAGMISPPVYADGAVFPDDLGLSYLGVRYHRVSVTVDDGHAVTRVEQEFYNPYGADVKGQYLFPIFPGSELTRFQVFLDNATQAVTRQDGRATNAYLYAAIAGRRDPSLLRYADWETLTFEVVVPAGRARRMVLEYEEVLAPSGGLYRYHYVLSTERYAASPLEEVSLAVDVRLSAGLASVYSPSHAVTVARQDGQQARVSWQERNARPTEDFDLFFAPADSGFGGGLLTGRRGERGHFMFLFSPQAQASSASRMPKDIVFVIDRSGSMAGEKIEQARNALRYFVDRLGEADRFSIVAFDDRITPLSAELLAPGPQALSAARGFVGSLTADGSTDIDAALREGLAILARSPRRDNAARLLVFLTDGLPTAGVVEEEVIVANATGLNREPQARLHAFGVGYDVNTHLLDRLAAQNGGSVTYVQPGENLERALTDFYDRVDYPVLTGVDVQFEGLAVSAVYPQQLPDLFDGSSLIVTGQYEAGAPAATVRVRGRAGEEWKEYVYQFDLAQTGDHDFVPRLWATRRVGELLDQVRVSGQTAERVDAIRELGLGYGVVTPYTSFVIEAPASGAASAGNMLLYSNLSALNQSSGQITIQARVQNQAYQGATQANLAVGANIYNYAQRSLAQFAGTPAQAWNVDLSLFQGRADWPGGPISLDWLEQNVGFDEEIEFASEAYFRLASDPAARAFLQSGANVIFAYAGRVIRVQDGSPVAGGQAQPLPAAGGAGLPSAPPAPAAVTADEAGPAGTPWWAYATIAAAVLWLAHLPLLAKLAKRAR